MSRKRPSAQELADERTQVRAKALSEAERRERHRDDTRKTLAERDAYVRAFVAADQLSTYPADPAMADDENRVVEYDGVPLHDALAAEIGRVFALTARPPPIEPTTMAQWILTSYDVELASDIEHLGPADARPCRLLAHIETMGTGSSPVEAASIARRAALLLLNRGRA